MYSAFCPFFPSLSPNQVAQHTINNPTYPFSFPFLFPFHQFTQQYYKAALQQQPTSQKCLNTPLPTLAEQKKERRQSPIKRKGKGGKKVENENYQKKKAVRVSTSIIQQKQGRNAHSNLLRMFFRRLELKIDSQEQKISRIIQRYNLGISIQEFSLWVQQLNVDYRNYIRVSTIKKAFRNHANANEFTCLMRILFKIFVEEESLCCYLTSKKIKKNILSYSLKCLRTISQELYGEDRD